MLKKCVRYGKYSSRLCDSVVNIVNIFPNLRRYNKRIPADGVSAPSAGKIFCVGREKVFRPDADFKVGTPRWNRVV